MLQACCHAGVRSRGTFASTARWLRVPGNAVLRANGPAAGEVARKKPHLQFVELKYLANEKSVRTGISLAIGFFGRRPGKTDSALVRAQEPRKMRGVPGGRIPRPARWGQFRCVRRFCDVCAAQEADSLRESIDDLGLLVVMLNAKQM